MKTTVNAAFFLRWAKRLLVYGAGLYLIASGVALSARSGLGVSPVGSLANVIYQIGLARQAPAYVTLGNCTLAVYSVYVLVEAVILGRDFRPSMLLQLLVSVLFGRLVDLAAAMLSFLPAPPHYALRMLYLLGSIPLVAAGVSLYILPELIPTPGEGMTLAMSRRMGITVGTAKVIFDCSIVTLSVLVSLLYFHSLVGVREGTVISALLVGLIVRRLMTLWESPIRRFVERDANPQ